MPRVVLSPPLPHDVIEIARASAPAGYTIDVVNEVDPEALRALRHADFFVGLPRTRLDDAFFEACANVKLVQLLRRGLERVDCEAARSRGVVVATIRGGVLARAVAEHTVLLMLAVARRLPWQDRLAKNDGWSVAKPWKTGTAPSTAPAFPAIELAGKSLGIVGMGAIGREVARIAGAFGLRVQYTSRTPLRPDDEAALAATCVRFDELLRTSDVVSLHCPLSEQTHGLIGAKEIAAMKRGAILINVSRGALVSEPALLDALEGGHLHGAGLDVLADEPPVPGHSLLTRDDVIVTPHSAWLTRECWPRLFAAGFANIERVAAGAPPLDRIA
jgi:glycerate dehydrogenase